MLWQRAACLARYSVKWSRRVPCRVNGLAARLRPGAEPLPGLDTGGWRLQFKDHEQGKLVSCALFPAFWALQLEAGGAGQRNRPGFAGFRFGILIAKQH